MIKMPGAGERGVQIPLASQWIQPRKILYIGMDNRA
jgi:hypothetical protein